MIGDLVMRLFHARTAAHVMHLQTRSYAAHKALNEFYDGVVDLADVIAEAYQGDYGLINSFPCRYVVYSEPLVLMNELADWVDTNRYKCCDRSNTYIQAAIDDVMTLIRQTTYKLRFLK